MGGLWWILGGFGGAVGFERKVLFADKYQMWCADGLMTQPMVWVGHLDGMKECEHIPWPGWGLCGRMPETW